MGGNLETMEMDKTRLRNLIRLGIVKYKAWEYANSRKGTLHTSPIITRSITNDSLHRPVTSSLRIIIGKSTAWIKGSPYPERSGAV